MGTLKEFNVPALKDRFNLDYLIETGLGEGESLKSVLYFKFKRVYSIDIDPEAIRRVRVTLPGAFPYGLQVSLLEGSSAEVLPRVLPEVSDGNVLFWLDAHYPCHSTNGEKYGTEPRPDLRLPLETELQCLLSHRDISKDVILIDDLRIYEDGPFPAGNWEDRAKYGASGCQFVFDLLDPTHIVTRSYRSGGFLECLPRRIDDNT